MKDILNLAMGLLMASPALAEVSWSRDSRGYIDREVNREKLKFVDFGGCYFVNRASIYVDGESLTIKRVIVLYSDADTQRFDLNERVYSGDRSRRMEIKYKSYCLRGYYIEANSALPSRFSAQLRFVGELSTRNSGIYYDQDRELSRIDLKNYNRWIQGDNGGWDQDRDRDRDRDRDNRDRLDRDRLERERVEAERRRLEEERLRLERERLEMERRRLEEERQRLEKEKRDRDRTPPTRPTPPPTRPTPPPSSPPSPPTRPTPPPSNPTPPPTRPTPPPSNPTPPPTRPTPPPSNPTPPPPSDPDDGAAGICPIGTSAEACASGSRYCEIHNDDDTVIIGISRKTEDGWGPCKRHRPSNDSD